MEEDTQEKNKKISFLNSIFYNDYKNSGKVICIAHGFGALTPWWTFGIMSSILVTLRSYVLPDREHFLTSS